MIEPLLVIVGASGAGRRVLDIALDVIDTHVPINYSDVAVVDDLPSDSNLAKLAQLGVQYLGTTEQWLSKGRKCHFTIGIGDTSVRHALSQHYQLHGQRPTTLVAPTARVSRSAQLGEGCVISPGVDISANAHLGDFVHVMANAAVSHDSFLESYVNINPGAVIAGACTIRRGTTIGAGSTVLQGLEIGHQSVVGAGACVVRNVPACTVVKGVPAR